MIVRFLRERINGQFDVVGVNRQMVQKVPNYWIVGAARRGTDDHYLDFVGKGYWKCFWADEPPGKLTPAQTRQVELSRQIKQGDWIAIKKKRA
jgi:hypothetical protein